MRSVKAGVPDPGSCKRDRIAMAARERYPQAVNLSIDVALLREARECDINLSATLERALSDAHGAFADTLRTF